MLQQEARAMCIAAEAYASESGGRDRHVRPAKEKPANVVERVDVTYPEAVACAANITARDLNDWR